MSGEGLITIIANHSVSDIMLRIERVLTERGISVFARVDHAEGARSVSQSNGRLAHPALRRAYQNWSESK